MALHLAVGQRSPLHLIAFDTRILVTALRRDDRGRQTAALGLIRGPDPAVELEVATGDTVDLHGRISGTRTLRATVDHTSPFPVTLTEIAPTAR